MQAAETPVHADTALAVYLEPYARDARVLLFDAEEGAVGARLGRVASELERPAARALADTLGRGKRLPYQDGRFDLVVVVDAASLSGGSLRGALAECVRVLARKGLVVVAQRPTEGAAPRRTRRAENDDPIARELSGLLANVRPLVQSALAGYALSPVTRERLELSIDSRLVRDQPVAPVRTLLVASDAALPDDGRLWIEVPAGGGSAPGGGVDARVYESLRRAEDDAREALRRESELLREVEHLRRAEEHAVALEKRARSFEQKLLAAEADYDDAVGKVRYFEAQVAERERALHKERELHKDREREFGRIEGALSKADAKLARANEAADEARAEADAARAELEGLEAQLREAAGNTREAQAETKRAQEIARDLVEELRRFERGALERAEHDTRVVELSAERDRAVARALEAEVARESAQLRADELRAELLAIEGAPRHDAAASADVSALEADLEDALHARRDAEHRLDDAERARARAEAALEEARADISDARERTRELEAELSTITQRTSLLGRLVEERDVRLAALQLESARADILARQVESLEQQLRASLAPVGFQAPSLGGSSEAAALRGERTGLALRLHETEAARSIAQERVAEANVRIAQADARSDELERRIAALYEELHAAPERSDAREPAGDVSELEDLRDALARAEQRIDDLTRELDEADRIAAVHAEDSDRLEALEAELETARRHMDELDDDVRGRDEEMRQLRSDSADQVSAAEGRIDEARRRENEARTERDAAHAALSEARGMLSQLAEHFGVSEREPAALLDAVNQRSGQPSLVDALRAALSEAQDDRQRAQQEAANLARELDLLRERTSADQDPPEA